MAESAELDSPCELQLDSLLPRYRALLEMADLVARHDCLPELLRELAGGLRQIASFDTLILSLRDPARQLMKVNLLEEQDRSSVFEWDMDGSASGWVWQHQQALIIPAVLDEERFATSMTWLRQHRLKSLCMLPLTTAQRRLGALGFASACSIYSARDVEFLHTVAELVALAVDNALTRQALNQDNDRLQLSLEISKTLSSSLQFERIFPLISDALRRVVPLDHISISVLDSIKDGLNLYLVYPPVEGCNPGLFVYSADSLAAPAIRDRAPKCYSRSDLEQTQSSMGKKLLERGIQHACCFPLITSRGVIGTLNVASMKDPICQGAEADLLFQIANHVAIAMENARAYEEIASLKNKLAEEKIYLEDEIRTELNFEEIIGESSQLRQALADAKTVAPSNANVMVLGETGTGKELIARAIHKMSKRKDNSFIKLNCSAIPTGLLESELFGHEKGAFTGAISQKVGRMELANGGTLFLDEVGDIPLELQPKLLRVLQDQEFERLGSTRTIRVNVRLIAATNRDLASLVVAREFRSDLYYRLRVFPIQLPPLRERREDIPMLVRYFVQRLSRRLNKTIDSIPSATMDVLTGWDWPGNVRELENFLERSVILSKGPSLAIPAAELRPLTEAVVRRDTSLESAEREHIIRILRETSGIISGTRGAAARLGLKRTTLQSKMQKLGISRLDYQN